MLCQEEAVLQGELRHVIQHVNLFEKVLIPHYQEAIRRIRIHLGDEMTAAIGRAENCQSQACEGSGGELGDNWGSEGERMIVPMAKTYITARHSDRHRLLSALADLEMVHLAPVESIRKQSPDEETLGTNTEVEASSTNPRPHITPDEGLDRLYSHEATSGSAHQTGTGPVFEAAQETLDIVQRRTSHEHHLTELHHQLHTTRDVGRLRAEERSNG